MTTTQSGGKRPTSEMLTVYAAKTYTDLEPIIQDLPHT